MNKSCPVCEDMENHQYAIDVIDRLTSELEEARNDLVRHGEICHAAGWNRAKSHMTSLEAENASLTVELAEYRKQNELYRLTINAENDRLDRNNKLEMELSEWHSVFGHLSKDPDEAGNIIIKARDGIEQELEDSKINQKYYYNLWNQAEDRIKELKEINNKYLLAIKKALFAHNDDCIFCGIKDRLLNEVLDDKSSI